MSSVRPRFFHLISVFGCVSTKGGDALSGFYPLNQDEWIRNGYYFMVVNVVERWLIKAFLRCLRTTCMHASNVRLYPERLTLQEGPENYQELFFIFLIRHQKRNKMAPSSAKHSSFSVIFKNIEYIWIPWLFFSYIYFIHVETQLHERSVFISYSSCYWCNHFVHYYKTIRVYRIMSEFKEHLYVWVASLS